MQRYGHHHQPYIVMPTRQPQARRRKKVYAGLKASAMWCYYNNDPVMGGATYGKLYNWYAAKLLQTDIDAYNAENPTTPWGWKVPTDAEWETLRTTVASLGWNYDGSTDLGSVL